LASACCQPPMTCLLALGSSLSEMKSRQAAHSGATLSAASHLPLQKCSRSFSMQNSTTETVASATRCSTCLALAIFVQFPIWVAFASAQSPSSAVREFGLFGTWADDCNTNPSPLNQYASFSISSRGTIQLRNDFGPDYGDMIYRIVDAKRIGLFRISLRQLLTTDDQIALDTVMLKSGGADSYLVVARCRRKRICGGWPDSGSQQPRNRLDGTLRHEVGKRSVPCHLTPRALSATRSRLTSAER